MSTSSLEHIAEDLISHALQRQDVLVAKPKFDHDGADLLALLDVSDGTKFCRIQCKGRSFVKGNRAHIEIPFDYVTDAFIVILFIEDGEMTERNMYCFFGKDIRTWNKNKNNKYTLSFTKLNYKQKLSKHAFFNNTINNIKEMIINVNIKGEFKTMGHGYAVLELPALTIEDHAK